MDNDVCCVSDVRRKNETIGTDPRTAYHPRTAEGGTGQEGGGKTGHTRLAETERHPV